MCSRGSPFSPLLMQLSIMRACKYPRGKCSSGNIQGNLLKRSQAHCPVSTGSNGVDALKCLSKINNTHHQEGDYHISGGSPSRGWRRSQATDVTHCILPYALRSATVLTLLSAAAAGLLAVVCARFIRQIDLACMSQRSLHTFLRFLSSATWGQPGNTPCRTEFL